MLALIRPSGPVHIMEVADDTGVTSILPPHRPCSPSDRKAYVNAPAGQTLFALHAGNFDLQLQMLAFGAVFFLGQLPLQFVLFFLQPAEQFVNLIAGYAVFVLPFR